MPRLPRAARTSLSRYTARRVETLRSTDEPDLRGQFIGDIAGLDAAVRAVAAYVALRSGEGNAAFKDMHRIAHMLLGRTNIAAPQIDPLEIKARAEKRIDDIFGDMNISYGPSPDDPAAGGGTDDR